MLVFFLLFLPVLFIGLLDNFIVVIVIIEASAVCELFLLNGGETKCLVLGVIVGRLFLLGNPGDLGDLGDLGNLGGRPAFVGLVPNINSCVLNGIVGSTRPLLNNKPFIGV